MSRVSYVSVTLLFCLWNLAGNVSAQTFAVGRSYPAPTHPNAVAIGDFNGDTLPDLAVISWSPNVVSVYLANVEGGFNAYTSYPVGAGPRFLVTGDMNRDGRLDLVVANDGSSDVSVLLGNGLGGFGAQRRFFSGSLPYHLALADLNGDAYLDAIVANSGGASVSVMLGDTTGGFRPAVPFAVGSTPRGVAPADFNGDGWTDVAVSSAGTNQVTVLLGDGAGGLATAGVFAVGSTPYAPAAADFNGDGHVDLAVPNFGAGTVSLLLGTGTGWFTSGGTLTAGQSPRSVAASDLNADGNFDLVVTNRDGNTVTIFLGDGGGTFTTTGRFGVDFGPFHTLPLDADRDGLLDLVVVGRDSHTVSVLKSLGGGAFSAPRAFSTGLYPRGVAVGDLDGDGRADVVTANNLSNTASVLLSTGDGQLSGATHLAVKQGPYAASIGDFDGDGTPDIIVANASANSVSMLRGNGSGGFAAQLQSTAGSGPRAIAAADVNQDGRLDIVSANFNGGTVSVLTNKGNGTFNAPVALAAGTNPTAVVLTDVNNDGLLDIAVTNAGTNDVRVLLATGVGTFGAASAFPTGSAPSGVTAADLNGDGLPDLAVSNETGNSVTVLRNNGVGTFVVSTTIAVGTRPLAIGTADFNNDGKADLATANATSNTISILLGNGDATFQPPVSLPAGTFARAVAFGDFDGDGRTDIVAGNANANEVWVILNRDGTTVDLSVSVSNGASSVRRGEPTTYEVSVSNAGPSTVDALTLSVSSPPGLLTPTMTPSTGMFDALSGAWTDLSLAPGQHVTLSVSGVISMTAAGTISVGASVGPPPGAVDPVASNNTASDVDAVIAGDADLGVSVANGLTAVAAGDTLTYAIVATNNGPTAVDSAVVSTSLPPTLQGVTWSCLGSAGGTCAAAGTGPINATVTLPVDASVTFTLQGTIDALAETGLFTVAASVTAPADVVDPNAANDSAADTDPLAGNSAPVAEPQTVSVAEDSPVAETLTATDAENNPIVYTVETGPAHGTLHGTAPALTYTPAANYHGADSFTFQASDGGLSTTATITIAVTSVNDAPVASGASVSTNEDVAKGIALSAIDVDGDALSFTLLVPPAHGTLTGLAPNVTYTPAPNYFGPDSFQFVASDGQEQTAPATVSLTVGSVNDTPTIVGPLADIAVNGTSTATTADASATFADVETSAASLVLSVTSSDPSLVTASMVGTTVNLALAANRSGSATVTVRATDADSAWVEDSFVVTITRPGVRLSVGDTSRGEGNSAGLVFSISLSGPSTGPVSVSYQTADGTANAGADYVAASGTVTFAPGVTTRTVTVSVVNDVLDEQDETVRLLLNSPTGGAVLDDHEGIGTIVDNDTATISLLDISVSEGNGGITTATFMVTLSTPSALEVTLSYATANLSALAGVDYVAQNGSLTFAAGTNSPQPVAITVNGDLLDEVDEAFNLLLSNAVNATISRPVGRATITDDDNAPLVSISDASVTEGNSGTRAMTFTVSLSTASGQNARVRYQSADSTATAGSDYVARSGEVVFEAGITTKTVTIVVNGDVVSEPTEAFSVVLHTPTLLTLGDSIGTGTIVTDDP